jgi:diguanylate cyclase (GGDEF)-like protein
MLERLATRTIFWGMLAIVAGAGGLMSLGSAVSANAPHLLSIAAPLSVLESGFPSFTRLAPFLSFAAFTMAVVGLALLRLELRKREQVVLPVDSPDELRVRQLHDAMLASVDGVFLLRPHRDETGSVLDFEISDVNPAGAALVKADRSTLLGRRLRRDFPAMLHEPVVARYTNVVASRQSICEELRVSRRLFAGKWLSHQAVPTTDGLVVTLRDTSAHKREEMRLRRASLTDELTRLNNRRGFLMLADQQLRIARRQMKDAVLLYVDMDEFKELNDRFGHAEGDRALVAVGRLLRRAVRDCDVVGRMGGDEFTIMALDADRVAARIIQRRIEERVALLNASGELAAPVSLTIGHTRVRPSDTAGVAELLARADSLLYARKKRRKLTTAAAERAATRPRVRLTLTGRNPSGSLPGTGLVVPPDVAAIARATAVAAAARVPNTSATFGASRVS